MFEIRNIIKEREEKREKKKLEFERKESELELERKQYENTRSICLDCRHAFYQSFITNANDPMTLICRRKLEITKGLSGEYDDKIEYIECYDNHWYRKCIHCSDFEKR